MWWLIGLLFVTYVTNALFGMSAGLIVFLVGFFALSMYERQQVARITRESAERSARWAKRFLAAEDFPPRRKE